MELSLNVILGFAVLGIMVVFFLFYMIYNMHVLKRQVRRIAHKDRDRYLEMDKPYDFELLKVFNTVPQASADVAVTTVLQLVLTIGIMSAFMLGSFPYYVSIIAIIFMAVGGLAYLFSMEQFTTIISPSIEFRERFALYAEAVDLKFIGLICVWMAVLVLMLLVNVAVLVLVAIYTLFLVYRHYEMRWIKE